MGYYSGNGETSGGGSSVSLFCNGPAVGGAYYGYQRVKTEVNVKNGVSDVTAKAAQGDMNLTHYQWPGGGVTPACKGSKTSVSFSQINGSNLYALTTTEETIQFRAKQGNFDSGWMS